MSREQRSWLVENLEFISNNWEPVDDPEKADLRITTEQIAIKIFEYTHVPKGTIEMLQEKLLEQGFKRAVITWDPIPEDPLFSKKDDCWAVCWLLKKKVL
jgi:hypothetical protein